MNGRPPDYTPEIAAEICQRLSDGHALRQICRDMGIPRRTVSSWVVRDYEGFAEPYQRAYEMGLHEMADEMLEIVDGAKDAESAAVARVRIDPRKWLLSKRLPKIYGDKVQHTGSDGSGPAEIVMQIVTGVPREEE